MVNREASKEQRASPEIEESGQQSNEIELEYPRTPQQATFENEAKHVEALRNFLLTNRHINPEFVDELVKVFERLNNDNDTNDLRDILLKGGVDGEAAEEFSNKLNQLNVIFKVNLNQFNQFNSVTVISPNATMPANRVTRDVSKTQKLSRAGIELVSASIVHT